MTNALPETVDGLPNISGSEDSIREAIAAAAGRPVYPPDNGVDFGRIRSAFAVALHMHQPLIPAGGPTCAPRRRSATCSTCWTTPAMRRQPQRPGVSWCYKRMGEFIPQLVDEGSQPRVMLEYSGTLLHGLRQMGPSDVIDALRPITCDPRYRDAVEWLGCRLGARRRALDAAAGLSAARAGLAAPLRGASSGWRRCGRVRGFSPSGDGAAEPSRRRLRVRAHAERLRLPVGAGPGAHRRACPTAAPAASASTFRTAWSARNSARRDREIIAIVKTQGSDTKLVGQMQPLLRGQGPAARWELAGRQRPAAGHADRRRRERRGDDERVPAEVHGGDAGVLGDPTRR